MIAKRYSIKGYYFYRDITIFDFVNLFDSLCEWDNVEKVDQTATYRYGSATIKIAPNTTLGNGYRWFIITLSIGNHTYEISAKSDNGEYINFIIAKTATSVGIMAATGIQGGNVQAGAAFSNQLRFVLTKCHNLDTGTEEKGIVVGVDSENIAFSKCLVASENNLNTEVTSNIYLNTNASSTVLYPATSAGYSGYCSHVFIPVFQTSNYTNSKCTVNGSTYYILGGTMYLLDD